MDRQQSCDRQTSQLSLSPASCRYMPLKAIELHLRQFADYRLVPAGN
jgi:hypothetical protein